jgi:glutaredoxin
MNTITCPHCHKSFELTDALTHQIEEDLLAGEKKKHEEELVQMKQRLQKAEEA